MMFSMRSLMLGIALTLSTVSIAQAHPADSLLAATPAQFAAANMPAADVGAISYLDFSEMDAAWWKDFSRAAAQALLSSDDLVQERAMQSIIFFATYYPEQADFRRTAAQLLQIYRYEQDEQQRVLALSALNALGDETAMRHLAQDVEHETSERLRRLATAAVNHYFGETNKPAL